MIKRSPLFVRIHFLKRSYGSALISYISLIKNTSRKRLAAKSVNLLAEASKRSNWPSTTLAVARKTPDRTKAPLKLDRGHAWDHKEHKKKARRV